MRHLALAFTVALSLALPANAQTSDADKGYLTVLIEENLSGAGREVVIDGFEGALSSRATIAHLTVADTLGVWLDMKDITLDWNRAALLGGRIEISELSAASIKISRYPVTDPKTTSPESTPFALPELPVSVSIAQMTAAEILLGAPFLGEDVRLDFSGSVELAGGAGHADIKAHRLDGAAGQFDIRAGYDNTSRVLDLSVVLDEAADGIAARVLDLPGRPSVRLAIEGTGPLDRYQATLGLRTDDMDRLSGSFTMATVTDEGATDPTRRDISLDLSGDVTALFAPDYRDFFGPEVALRTDLSRDAAGVTTLHTLDLRTRSLMLTGSAVVGAEGWPERFDLRGTLADEAGAPVRLPIGGAATTLSHADLALTFDASTGDAWTADMTVTDFARPGLTIPDLTLTGGGTITNGDGAADGAFTADLGYSAHGLRLDNTALAEALGQTIKGKLSLSHMENAETVLNALTLRGPGLALDAEGTVGTADQGYTVQATIDLVANRLERFAALIGQPVAGAADVTVVSRYQPDTAAFSASVAGATRDLRLGIAQLDPLLAGDGTLSVLAERDGAGSRIKGLSIETSGTSLLANAALTSTGGGADLTLSLDDIGRSVPGLSGPVDLRAVANRDGAGVTTFTADLSAAPDTAHIDATLPADLDAERIALSLHTAIADLARFAPLAGRPIAGQVTADLAGTSMSTASAFDLTLSATTDTIRTGLPSVDVLTRGAGRLDAALERTEGGQLILRSLTATTPEINLSATLEGHDDTGEAQFEAHLADVAIFAPDFPGPADVTGTATLAAGGLWSIDTAAVGPGGSTAGMSGTMTSDRIFDLGTTGRAPLGLLNAVLEPRRIQGMANFDLRLTGPASVGALSGTIVTSDAELSAPTLGQSIKALGATIRLGGGAATIAANGTLSDGGQLAVNGSVGLSAPFSADLAATVQAGVLRDPELYDTTVDGRITLTGPLTGGASVAGVLTLGLTELRVPSSSIGALGDLPAVTHVAAPSAVRQSLGRAGLTLNGSDNAPQSASGPGYALDIAVNAPSRIFVRGRGLDAELGGALRLGGTTTAVVPSGQFDLIRGRLDILQQRFDLTEGRAAIQGNFSPYVRLVAATTARTGTRINVAVEGSITDPAITFTSQPDLPQDEILAQLIFGRDLSQISALQAVQLASAVSTLAGRGGSGLVDRLRGGIGLDDLDVTTDQNGDAAIRAGKYISENIYTDLTVSSSGSSEISLNLDISEDITAKGAFTTDGESTVGVFFEHDY